MNSEVQLMIEDGVQWSDLPPNLKQSLGGSHKEYEKYVISYSINNQLRHRNNLIRFVYKHEKKYYEELLRHSRDNLMLYPYHLADVIVKGLRVTPFQYYISIIESLMDNDKSYDSIPNFTAIDCLRLLGIGRNEYIDLMNQCRSGKKLFRRKNISKNLLPVKPVNIHIEPWWLIETGYITDEDIKLVSVEEKSLIDEIIDNGKQKAGDLNISLIRSLYRRGFIYLEVPIEDDDHVVVLTLEGFVMNRVLGDYLEKLLYKILVTIDERTPVKEVAAILQRDIELVKTAVSLCCRLNLAQKKGVAEPSHSSWHDVGKSPVCNARKNSSQIIIDDPLLNELNEALADTSLNFREENEIADLKEYELTEGSPDAHKRIAFFFDSTLTAFLMMGNLSPDLKKHAVKMFEAGKLTDEDLDGFLYELKNVGSVRDDSEGEAKRYFDHALILRETVLALKHHSNCIDLIRCESLHSLDQEIERFLQKNYFLLVSMAPLCREVRPICTSTLPHLGPPTVVVNTVWFKLFLYHTTGCGPPSILYPRGTRVKKIPSIFRNYCDKILMTSWGHEPACLPLCNMIFALNEALLYTPVLIQAYGKEEDFNNTCTVPFPFKEDYFEKGVRWSTHSGISSVRELLKLDNTCGYITMLYTNQHYSCTTNLPKTVVDTSKMNQFPKNGVTSDVNKALLEHEVDSMERDAARRRVRLSLPSTSRVPNANDWCVLDCTFGVPLFDRQLNSAICSAIVKDGLWNENSLVALMENNNHLSQKLIDFMQQYQTWPSCDEEFQLSSESPWPFVPLVYHNGQIARWDEQ